MTPNVFCASRKSGRSFTAWRAAFSASGKRQSSGELEAEVREVNQRDEVVRIGVALVQLDRLLCVPERAARVVPRQEEVARHVVFGFRLALGVGAVRAAPAARARRQATAWRRRPGSNEVARRAGGGAVGAATPPSPRCCARGGGRLGLSALASRHSSFFGPFLSSPFGDLTSRTKRGSGGVVITAERNRPHLGPPPRRIWKRPNSAGSQRIRGLFGIPFHKQACQASISNLRPPLSGERVG